jgi:hypothetical protein
MGFKRTETTRTCGKCLQEKPLTEFHKRKQDRLGVQSRCKACNHSRPSMQIYKQMFYGSN